MEVQDIASQTLIASQAAAGIPQCEIAKRLGVHESTISRTLNKQQVREWMQQIQERFISEHVETAIGNIGHMVQSYKQPGKEIVKKLKDGTEIKDVVFDEQLREHGFRASMEIARSVGLLPSQAPSYYVQNNIYASVSHADVPPEVKQLMSIRDQQSVASEPVIDAEYEDLLK